MTSCSVCKTPSLDIPALESKNKPILIYYCFERAWEPLIVPILDSPVMLKLRKYILEHMLITLNIPEVVASGYKYDPKFLEELSLSKDKLALIDSKAWGKFSYTESEQDLKEFKIMAKDEYDDYKTLGHYLYNHECRLMAVFIWTVCKLVWPLKQWVIVDNGPHAFVMTGDDPHTVYDILWALGDNIPANSIDVSDLTIYESPMDFYIQCQYGLDPRKSKDELMQDLMKDYEVYKNEERLENRIKYELSEALAFKDIFSDM